jgi:hypothetical protein
MYIFDTNSFKQLFGFYPSRFPRLWALFDQLVADGRISSVKEVLREMQQGGAQHLDTDWAQRNKEVFKEPTAAEALVLSEIFANKHFQQSLERTKLLKGGPFADPFIIARAKVNSATVVTEEKEKPNGTKIPNICKVIGVKCTNLEGFMELEGWEF